jgi:RNA polymerase sigma-32 factor
MKQKHSGSEKGSRKAATLKPKNSSKRTQTSTTPKAISPEVLPALPSPHSKTPRREEDTENDTFLDQEGQENEGDENLDEPTESEIASSLPAVIEGNSGESNSDLESIPSSTDSLKRYLEEMKHYTLLEPQEEKALAIRFKEQGDLSAAKALVTANLRLVVKIAFEYRSFYTNVLDLIQEGNIGLMKAVSKFDPSQGTRLGYYASWWIRSYILKYLLDNFRLVKVGTTQAQKKLFYHLMREKEKLEAQGLIAGPKLLAEKLNVREKDVTEMEQRLSGRGVETSLEAPVYADEENQTSHKDLLVDGKESADEALGRQELIQILKGQLPAFRKTLNDKELRILSDRLLAEEPKTLQEVADLYGLTRERARQIEVKVIEKLRDFLQPILSPP